MKNGNGNHGRLLIGILLVALGSLFLLDNYGVLYFSLPDIIFEWEWILILLGLFLLATSRNKMAGSILIGIGLFNLFPEFWPLTLVAIGLYLILRNENHRRSAGKECKIDSSDEDFIDEVAILGGGTKNISSNNFRGGRITAIFGGTEIRLLDSKLAEGRNVLDVFAMFGGATIITPKDWNVNLQLTPIFGGFADKRFRDPNEVYDPDRTLVIKGIIIFGGGEIKSF